MNGGVREDARPGAEHDGTWRGRVIRYALAHPLLAIGMVAAAARILVVVAIALRTTGTVIPDAGQYLELATGVAEGRGADAYKGKYGTLLFRNTFVFTGPLAGIFWLFGPSVLAGQLLAAAGGVASAIAATYLALRALPSEWALGVGGVIALWPSQVFWSSVVIRESFVWTAIVGAAVGMSLATSENKRRFLAGVAVVAVSFVALVHLREQTLVVVAWAAVLAAVIVPGARRAARTVAVLVIAALVPLYGGLGIAGWSFVEREVPFLSRTRAQLATGADSAIVERHEPPVDPASGQPAEEIPGVGPEREPAEPGEGGAMPGSGGGSRPPDAVTEPPPTGDPQAAPPSTIVTEEGTYALTRDGHTYVIDETPRGNLRHLPAGLAGALARPYPWEPHAGKVDVLLAKLENVGWYLVYGLAAIGLWVSRRRLAVVAFPAISAMALSLASALTQGNAGTAFRHRGQILWALALLAILGLRSLALRRHSPDAEEEPVHPTSSEPPVVVA